MGAFFTKNGGDRVCANTSSETVDEVESEVEAVPSAVPSAVPEPAPAPEVQPTHAVEPVPVPEVQPAPVVEPVPAVEPVPETAPDHGYTGATGAQGDLKPELDMLEAPSVTVGVIKKKVAIEPMLSDITHKKED